jgi:hypothetical protein
LRLLDSFIFQKNITKYLQNIIMITVSYNNGSLFTGIACFVPFLEIIKKYPFPAPIQCTRTAKEKWIVTKITSFTSDGLLKCLATPQRYSTYIVTVDDTSSAHLNLSIHQKDDSTLILMNAQSFLKNQLMKQLFVDLIKAGPLLDRGWCGAYLSTIWERNLPNFGKVTQPILTWMQYYGKEELEKRGGFAAFESNPYVQTQRIHDGLLVQVGDSPDVFDTPEGEQLLVNAINALPPLKG